MGRKRYTTAFKDEACKLVTAQDYELATTARQLGIDAHSLRYWLVQRGWSGPKPVRSEGRPAKMPAEN